MKLTNWLAFASSLCLAVALPARADFKAGAAVIDITPWHWAGFIACVLFFLALDLGVFHREAHVVKFKEALAWTSVWFTLAMLFSVALRFGRGREESLEFLTGYLIELSLSMDNVFVIALIFAYFRVPSEYQHRVLFWGILGALLMGVIGNGLDLLNVSAYYQQIVKGLIIVGAVWLDRKHSK